MRLAPPKNKIIFFLLIIWFIYAIYQVKYWPIRNLFAKYHITISGKMDPSLRKKINLFACIYYATANPKCRYTVSYFGGVAEKRKSAICQVIKPNKHGAFKLSYPIDRYYSGYCYWQATSFYFDIKTISNNQLNGYQNGSFSFSNQIKGKPHYNVTQSWHCRDTSGKQGMHCKPGPRQPFSANNKMLRNHSYHIHLLIEMQAKKQAQAKKNDE